MLVEIRKNIKQRLSHSLGRFEKWCTYGNLAEAFLILTNGFLVIKTLANLSSILIEDSDGLILEYNGHLLFDSTFRITTILTNLLVFLTSLLSLMVILFTTNATTLRVRHDEYNMKRYKLIRYSTISQLVLAFFVLILMGKLWFCPPKLVLNRHDWESFLQNYDYGRAYYTYDNNNNNPNEWNKQRFTNPFDRLQQTLACCGFRSPSEWTNSQSGLLAPSCCLNPIISVRGEPPSVGHLEGRWIHYCASLDETIMRIDSNGLEIPVGCQQRLTERDSRFLFNLRMRLLLLLAALFLMVQASLTFYLPSIWSANSTCHTTNNETNNPDDDHHNMPPDYWHALSGSGVIVLVDKSSSKAAESKTSAVVDLSARQTSLVSQETETQRPRTNVYEPKLVVAGC